MLSDANIRKINSQIDDELRIVGRSFTSDEDKMSALARIEKLKNLLDPQATQPINAIQVADTVVSRLTEPKSAFSTSLLEEILTRILSRR